jgi:hypothetical protein
MSPVPITSDQVRQLQVLVADLVDKKTAADQATAQSNQSQTALLQAQAQASQDTTAEAQADGAVNVSLGALQAFIDGLAGPQPPAPNPAG